MNILVDTQILLWTQQGNMASLRPVEAILKDPNHLKWVSQISFFEIAIKSKVGKLPSFSLSLQQLIQQAKEDGFRELPISNAHIAAYERIPLFDQHRDPFDRLILATALAENWPVISADEKFRLYDGVVQLIW